MKKITQEQINGLLNVLVAYNVGIKDFEAVKNMFDKLPVLKEPTDVCGDKEENIDDKKDILDK